MSATVSSFANALKDVWTSEKLEEQIYQDNPLLDRIERTSRYTIGHQAWVPLHTDRSGGYSAMPAAGGALNTAQQQGINKAVYDLTHHYFQISLESAVVDQSANSAVAIAQALDVEVKGAVNDLRKQLNRQAFSNGDALIAKCGTTSSANVIVLDTFANGSFGYDAIKAGWLHGSGSTQGLQVDIGTSASQASLASGVVVTAVAESQTAPTITVTGSAISTTTSNFVSVKGARSGTTSYEMNGLRNIVSQSASLGGISAGATWQAADVDSTTTALTLDAIFTETRKVKQKTGNLPSLVVGSLKREQDVFGLLQNQIRFAQTTNLNTGQPNQNVMVGGIEFQAHPDCPDLTTFFLSLDDLAIVSTGAPRWMSDYQGANQGLLWNQGNTNFVDAITYRINLIAKRRNSHSAFTSLTTA